MAATAQPAGRAVAPGQLCRAAIAQAEREAGLPDRLLAAIGRVESGRREPVTGATAPWPWTINAEGRGSFFPDRAAAIAAVRALQAEGVRSIDVGCLQINLRHHPQAFTSLEEAFEPLANARYAARFLTELQATRGDWMRSAAHYHSQTPEHAEAYRAKVAEAWAAERGAPAAPGYAAALRAHGSFGAAGAPMLEASGARAATLLPPPLPPSLPPSLPPLGAGGVGRGLDAYRARPIVMIGRVTAPLPAMVVTPPTMGAAEPGRAAATPMAAPGLPLLASPSLGLPAPGRPGTMPPSPTGAGLFQTPSPAGAALFQTPSPAGAGLFQTPSPAGAALFRTSPPAGAAQADATFNRPPAAAPLVPMGPRSGAMPPRRS